MAGAGGITRQVAREARGLRPIGAAANEDGVNYYGADEGDSNEEELGGDSSESDVNEEGAGSQNQSLVIEDLDSFNLSLSTVAITDSTYLQTQRSVVTLESKTSVQYPLRYLRYSTMMTQYDEENAAAAYYDNEEDYRRFHYLGNQMKVKRQQAEAA